MRENSIGIILGETLIEFYAAGGILNHRIPFLERIRCFRGGILLIPKKKVMQFNSASEVYVRRFPRDVLIELSIYYGFESM